MKLSDKISAAIPAGTKGISVAQAVALCGGQLAYVERAFETLAASGSAILVKRGRRAVVHLVDPASGVLSCKVCRREFARKAKSKRVTCSKGCHSSLSWADPEKAAKRRASISKAHNTPKAKARLAAHNKRRWSDPEQKEKLAAQNRMEWKKPEKAAIRAAKIRLNHQKPEVREFYSKLRKADWARPEYAAMVKAKSAASLREQHRRAFFSDALKRRWADPVWRAKYTNANKERNRIKAEKAKAKKRQEVQP